MDAVYSWIKPSVAAEKPAGDATKSDVFAPGPICLQGDHGKVSYRNILLTPIVN